MPASFRSFGWVMPPMLSEGLQLFPKPYAASHQRGKPEGRTPTNPVGFLPKASATILPLAREMASGDRLQRAKKVQINGGGEWSGD